jgi:hypothetical protein
MHPLFAYNLFTPFLLPGIATLIISYYQGGVGVFRWCNITSIIMPVVLSLYLYIEGGVRYGM